MHITIVIRQFATPLGVKKETLQQYM